MALHYLTVQDILWINLQVTKKVNGLNQVKLEEAVYYQYAYGDSKDLTAQAARFLTGFTRQHPLGAGNSATAFIAFAAFLEINGRHLQLTDGEVKGWFAEQATAGKATSASVQAKSQAAEDHHHGAFPNLQDTVCDLLARYPSALTALSD